MTTLARATTLQYAGPEPTWVCNEPAWGSGYEREAFENQSIQNRARDAHATACHLLLGAALDNPGCIAAIIETPPEVFPDDLKPIVVAVTALTDRNEPVGYATIAREMEAAGVENPFTLVGDLAQMAGNHVSCAPDLDSRALVKAYARRDAVDKLGVISKIADGGDLEAARHAFADLQPFEFVPAPTDPLPLADVANAGPVPESIFESGLYRARYNIVGGASNAGKSYLALIAALSVATGKQLVRCFAPRTRGRVLFLSGEDDAPVLRERVKDIATVHHIDTDHIPVDFVDQVNPLIVFDTRGEATFTAGWRSLRQRAQGYDLVIIDPLAAWFQVCGENPGNDFTKIGNALTELAKTTKAAVLLLHHTSKAGTFTLDQNSLRGHTGLITPARWISIIGRPAEKDLERLGLDEEDASTFLRYRVDKNSYGANSAHETILKRVDGGVLVDCDPLTQRRGDIAETLANVLTETAVHLTRREILQGRGDLAKDVRRRVEELEGKATKRDFERAIEHGLRFGLLQETELTTGGRLRVEVLPVC